MHCGLLGRKLGHSYSPQIHALLAQYRYDLFEHEPEDVENFLRSGDFTGLNVTMPYKTAVIEHLDELSPLAAQLGAVNTIVRRNGRLIGHNTDYFGFASMVARSGLSPAGKKCVIIGSGGVSKPAGAVMRALGAQVVILSHRENTPKNLKKHADAAILVNASPVGMYPACGDSPVDLAVFPHVEGVLDLIFNPARTALLLQAEKRGIVAMNGLWMLVAQAKEASEWFQNTKIDDSVIEPIYRTLEHQMENIVLIGMPGCGKSTLAQALACRLGKKFVDADAQVCALAGKTIPQIFADSGEEGFRKLETEALAQLGKGSGQVIATGGGCVTREENYDLLHQNGTILWIKRDTHLLATDGRPLSQANSPQALYAKREPLYRAFADAAVDNNGEISQTLTQILQLPEVIQ